MLAASMQSLCVSPSESDVIARIVDADIWYSSAVLLAKGQPSLQGTAPVALCIGWSVQHEMREFLSVVGGHAVAVTFVRIVSGWGCRCAADCERCVDQGEQLLVDQQWTVELSDTRTCCRDLCYRLYAPSLLTQRSLIRTCTAAHLRVGAWDASERCKNLGWLCVVCFVALQVRHQRP